MLKKNYNILVLIKNLDVHYLFVLMLICVQFNNFSIMSGQYPVFLG